MRQQIEELMTCKELAASLHVGRTWVCAAVMAGAPRVTTRLYRRSDFIRWMERNPDFRIREVFAAGKATVKKRRRGHRKGTPKLY